MLSSQQAGLLWQHPLLPEGCVCSLKLHSAGICMELSYEVVWLQQPVMSRIASDRAAFPLVRLSDEL